jgi:FtsP/CotA-like multicopper oxidase with cupredoxin domain
MVCRRTSIAPRRGRQIATYDDLSFLHTIQLDRRQAVIGITATITALPLQAQQSPQTITLTATTGKRRLRPEPAPETDVWTYNGETPGPVIRLKQNQPATIRLVNDLKQPTTLHLSGYRIANAMDGVAGLTQAAVQPGQSFDLTFTPQDAGVYLYHPLMPTAPGQTSEQVERGLSGLLIVEEASWSAEIDRDVAVLLDDWRLAPDGLIEADFKIPADNARLGRLGNTLTINGKPVPEVITLPPRSRVRLRIGGIMNARVLPMTFKGMARATCIAIDGQPCEQFDPLRKQVIVAPGSRYDMVLDMPETAGAETVIAVALGDGLPVMRSPSCLSIPRCRRACACRMRAVPNSPSRVAGMPRILLVQALPLISSPRSCRTPARSGR